MPLSRPTTFTRTDTTPPMPSTTSPKPSPSHWQSESHQPKPTCCASGTRTTRDAYEALPPDGSKARAVLFIGGTLPDARLLADALSRAGLYVVLPDFFQGDPVPVETGKPEALAASATAVTFGPWLARHREGVARPLVEGAVKALREDPEVKSLGVVGFCWGGRYAMLLAADGSVDAAVVNHPSLLSLPAEVEAVTKPVQVNIGDKDAMLDAAGIKTIQDALKSKPDVPSEVNAVRGPTEEAQQEQAMQNAVRWFQTYLK